MSARLGGVVTVQGPRGDRGYSAYQDWLRLPGNAGKTEAQFFAFLAGQATAAIDPLVGEVRAARDEAVAAANAVSPPIYRTVISSQVPLPDGTYDPATGVVTIYVPPPGASEAANNPPSLAPATITLVLSSS